MKTSAPTRGHADAVAQAHLPLAIWALGVVSLLMDISSELIHSLLPVFLVSSLGASVFTVGWIEGAGESLALIIKVFSGSLSDWLGQRKGLAVVGYGLGALSKPLFAVATSPIWFCLHVCWIEPARVSAAPPAIPWWPTWRRPRYAGRLMACAKRSIPSAPSPARCWRSH